MKKKVDLDNYVIYDMQSEKRNDSYALKWKFRQADGFVVAIFVVGAGKGVDTVCSLLAGKESQFLEKRQLSGNKYKLLQLSADEFLINSKQYRLDNKHLIPGVPCLVSVYPYHMEGDEMEIYEVDPEANTVAFPVPVNVKVSYKKGLFSSVKKCTLNVQHIEDYPEGALCYRPQGSKIGIPLSQKCLGKNLLIFLQGNEEIEVRVDPEYRDCYKIKLM